MYNIICQVVCFEKNKKRISVFKPYPFTKGTEKVDEWLSSYF